MRWPVSAKAVVLRDGSVLLARNDRDEWELPGGRVERGEDPAAAAEREVAEETGLRVQTTSQLGLAPFEVVPGRVVLIAAFACRLLEEREPVVSEEHTAVAWWPLGSLDDLPLPTVYRDFIALGARGRVVLLGDSHLAKLDRPRLQRLSGLIPGAPFVVDHATGGSTVLDVLTEVEHGAFLPQDRIVVSVGTNDSASWKRVPLHRFRSAVDDVVSRLRHHRLVLLAPPPVDAALQIASGREHVRTEREREPYAAVLEEAAAAHGARVVAVAGVGIHAADGVHLNDAGMDLLIRRLAEALGAMR